MQHRNLQVRRKVELAGENRMKPACEPCGHGLPSARSLGGGPKSVSEHKLHINTVATRM